MLPPMVDEEAEILDENGEVTRPIRTSPVRVPGNLDVHSCLMFLEGLYGQWLSPMAVPRTPLMLICETVKSVSVSDYALLGLFFIYFDLLCEHEVNNRSLQLCTF